eukprot:14803122-Alexandrium_andersonii.AAC.1
MRGAVCEAHGGHPLACWGAGLGLSCPCGACVCCWCDGALRCNLVIGDERIPFRSWGGKHRGVGGRPVGRTSATCGSSWPTFARSGSSLRVAGHLRRSAPAGPQQLA